MADILRLHGIQTVAYTRAEVLVSALPDRPERGSAALRPHLDALTLRLDHRVILQDALAERLRLRPLPPPQPEPELADLVQQGRARLAENRQQVDRRWLIRQREATDALRGALED